jgi:TonB family protein
MSALQSSPALAWLLSYLFNALWQISLVFAAAWLASLLLRRAGPHAEHRLWVGALLLQIVLPACHLRAISIGSLWAGLWTTLRGLLPWAKPDASSVGSTRVFFGPGIVGSNSLHLPSGLLAGIALAYAGCLLYFAGRLAWGFFATRALGRTATRITLTGEAALRWTRCCHRLGISALLPEIAASTRVTGPVTVGVHPGLVLLPPALLENIASPTAMDDLDAVLAHELAHIRRHDFAKNLLYGLVSLPIAWHPLVWRTRARVSETRELICDALACDAIACDAIAGDANAADAVAGRRQYAQSLLRLASMLIARPPVRTLHAIGIFDPIGIFNLSSTPGTFERRIMVLTHKRNPIGATRGLLIAATCAILALATCASALALHTNVFAADSKAASGTPKIVNVRPEMMAGNRISGENPTYPPEARKKKIQGTVVIDTTVSKEGAIDDLHVVKTPDPSLAESALKAVRTWRYRPYLLNGDPVAVQTTVNVTYCLEPCKLSGWWNHR